jgi:NAD(P)-dependent dehydrogenase (short-subunit alcohol dehydrogenase family)
MIKMTLEAFGRVDILINNAGGLFNAPNSIEATTIDDWNKVISANLTGTFFCCKAVLPVMKKNGSGKIVNVSSQSGRTFNVLTGPAYSSAKAGVLGLTKQLAYEMGPYAININAVAPGIMLTEPRVKKIWYSIPEEKRNFIVNTTPLRRTGEPEEIAKVIAFLCTDDAKFITGACLDINGGMFMP